jgi:hypothetical protein
MLATGVTKMKSTTQKAKQQPKPPTSSRVTFQNLARLFDVVPDVGGAKRPTSPVVLETNELMACLQVPLLLNMFQMLDDKDGKQGDGALDLEEVELVMKSPSFWKDILGDQKTGRSAVNQIL